MDIAEFSTTVRSDIPFHNRKTSGTFCVCMDCAAERTTAPLNPGVVSFNGKCDDCGRKMTKGTRMLNSFKGKKPEGQTYAIRNAKHPGLAVASATDALVKVGLLPLPPVTPAAAPAPAPAPAPASADQLVEWLRAGSRLLATLADRLSR